MGLVLGPALLLAVDQEQRDDDAVVPLAHLAPDVDVGEVVVNRSRLDGRLVEFDGDDATALVALPDPLRPAGTLVDCRPRHGAVGDCRRRYLGMVSIHDADGFGGTADGAERAD